MTAFFCGTMFQVFETCLLKRTYFRDVSCVIFIVRPLSAEDFDVEALRRFGFDEVIALASSAAERASGYHYERVFFFSLFCGCQDYIYSLDYEKLILAYEGITSYQLKHWSRSEPVEWFPLDTIDEFWLPDTDLLLDREFLPRCREFSLNLRQIPKEELRRLCALLNDVFRYRYQPCAKQTVFLDRYLSAYGGVLSTQTEEALTQAIFFGTGGNAAIKVHPYDSGNLHKYRSLQDAELMKENLPWELACLNRIVFEPEKNIDKYIFYNSFAPVNTTLLFNERSYRCVCIELILDKYACIEGTFLNANTTREIFRRFSEKYQIEVKYLSHLEELNGCHMGSHLATDDVLWHQAETAARKWDYFDLQELRAFRLQLDCALLSIGKDSGSYYLTADNLCAAVSREVLRLALPQYAETASREGADLIVDCDGSLVNYAEDSFDVRHFSVVEGYCRLNDWKASVETRLKDVEHLYVWGTTRTNLETFRVLRKLQMLRKVERVFDSYATGENHGFPIEPFSPEKIRPNSFIFVCAEIAYPQIAKILTEAGFIEGKDFALGLGISHARFQHDFGARGNDRRNGISG